MSRKKDAMKLLNATVKLQNERMKDRGGRCNFLRIAGSGRQTAMDRWPRGQTGGRVSRSHQGAPMSHRHGAWFGKQRRCAARSPGEAHFNHDTLAVRPSQVLANATWAGVTVGFHTQAVDAAANTTLSAVRSISFQAQSGKRKPETGKRGRAARAESCILHLASCILHGARLCSSAFSLFSSSPRSLTPLSR